MTLQNYRKFTIFAKQQYRHSVKFFNFLHERIANAIAVDDNYVDCK